MLSLRPGTADQFKLTFHVGTWVILKEISAHRTIVNLGRDKALLCQHGHRFHLERQVGIKCLATKADEHSAVKSSIPSPARRSRARLLICGTEYEPQTKS